MISIEMAREDPTPFQQQLQRAVSADFGRPELRYLMSSQESRRRYQNQCVPLHKAALKGDWKKAKKLIEDDGTLLKAAITKGWATVLHVAVGANHAHFVQELVNLMDCEDLELQDLKGNTAFCFAAAVGNVQIAEILRRKNESLPRINGAEGVTTLLLAVLQGRREMAWYLFPKCRDILLPNDWNQVFLVSIDSGLYDFALEMLNHEQKMVAIATARGMNGETGLHVLARKPSLCGCQNQRGLLHFCKKDNSMLDLTKRIWEIFLTLDDSVMMDTITKPSQVIFLATEAGNFEFLSVVMSTYPDMIWELDTTGLSIIHTAVLHRHASIFNLIHEVGPIKEFIVTFVDDEQNNMLHCAAKLAPPDRLNMVSGAALQMMLELSWFEEVKKIMMPADIEKKNNAGYTPRQVFTMEHKELCEKGESWMKRTAKYCLFVSTLITTGVFSAAFSLPGGNNDNTETPNYLSKSTFLIFALSDTMALISSSNSILIFMSILISRYAQEDFLKSLPLKLISGLVALFISIISMMVAFSSAFFITYYHGLKWVPSFIAALAFVPIPLFIYLQFPLWSDIVYSAYICSSLFRPSKCMIN